MKHHCKRYAYAVRCRFIHLLIGNGVEPTHLNEANTFRWLSVLDDFQRFESKYGVQLKSFYDFLRAKEKRSGKSVSLSFFCQIRPIGKNCEQLLN